MNLNATLIGQMVAFVIFIYLTHRFVWPPIVAAMAERSKRIAMDDRHQDLNVFYRDAVQERQFYNWTMAYDNLDESPPKPLDGYSSFLEDGFANRRVTQNPSEVLELLKVFREYCLRSA